MSEKRQRIPELDGLRVLMIFIVSWYHIWQQSWLRPMIGTYSLDYLVRSGYIWVDGTVLLSSFLLYLPYAKAKRNSLYRTPGPITTAGPGESCRVIISLFSLCFFPLPFPADCMTARSLWSRIWQHT